MTDNTKDDNTKLYTRIKALLAKTTEAGCTEEEAATAAEKARQLIEAYQVNMTEFELVAEGFTQILFRWSSREISNVQRQICVGIAYYTGTRGWMANDGKTQQQVSHHFFGLKSDVMFAGYLLSSLTNFIIREADQYIKSNFHHYYNAKKERADFIFGCAKTISARLIKERKDTVQVKGTGTALVTIDKRSLVTAKLAEKHNIILTSTAGKRKDIHSKDNFEAGKSKGNEASFSRPLGNSGPVKMLK
jgi:hypothetical protein